VSAIVQERSRGVGDWLRVAVGVSGIVALAVGIIVLVWPGKTAMVVTAVVGIYLIVVGLGFVGSALFRRTLGGWGRLGHLLLGLLYVVAGVLALVDLAAATVSLAVLLAILVGIMWVVEGVVALTTLGITAAPRVWTVLFALLSIVAGVLLFVSPLWAAATLWWLLGIWLVVLGVAQIVRALAWKV
jgi:uncharacterized membrane protein HdeD (DUF308 family)